MKKLLILLILAISIFAWERDYSFGIHHWPKQDIIQLSDSTFVFVGSNLTADPSSNFIVFRFDKNGDSLWIDYIGYPEDQNRGGAAMNISDSTFVVTGGHHDGSPCLFCYKYNREIHWMRVDTPLSYLDLHGYGSELEYDLDSNLVSNAHWGFTAFDIATGDITWSRYFENIDPYRFSSLDMEVVHMEPYGYLRAGYFRTDIPTDSPGSMGKVFASIAFYDTTGDTLWQRNYPTKDSVDWLAFKDIEVIDNPAPGMPPGLIAVGRSTGIYPSYNHPGFIVRTDLEGNIIWSKKMVHAGIDTAFGGRTDFLDILMVEKGPYQENFILLGDYRPFEYVHISKPFIMKISDTLEGEEYWSRTYDEHYAEIYASSLCLCRDGGFMLTGGIASASGAYADRIWFCRVDSLGYPLPISSVQEHEDYSLPSRLTAKAYPNPFNSAIDIIIEGYNNDEDISVSIYDITGNKIVTLENPGTGNVYKWNGRDEKGRSCPTGAYMYNVNYKDEKITGKILYLK